jgi:hypothetical protein
MYEELFPNGITQDMEVRDQVVTEAVSVHGFTQKAVADHLGMHYSTINRILERQQFQKTCPQSFSGASLSTFRRYVVNGPLRLKIGAFHGSRNFFP